MDMTNMTMPMPDSTKMINMGMQTSFYWGKDVVILFKNWPNNNLGMYILALFFVFCLAFIFEILSITSIAKLEMRPVAGGLIQAMVYAVRMAVAYLVMLSVMSYNLGVFFVVVAGHALGHFAVKFRAIGKANACRITDPNV